MRARNVLCTLGVGALAMSVSAYAAPREAQTGKSPRPESSRLIAGQGGEIRTGIDNGTIAAGQGPRVKLTPVAIVSGAGSISGDTATLEGGAAVIKFDGTFGGWGAASNLTTFQATINPATLASGTGTPLSNPNNACGELSGLNSPTCSAAFGAINSPGDLQCDQFYPGKCNNFWQHTERVAWPGDGTLPLAKFNIPGCNSSTYSCGGATSQPPVLDNGGDYYAFTVVFAADASAAGTYTISFDPLDLGGNFMQTVNTTVFAYAKISPGKVTIPTGRCCFNPGQPTAGCDANVDKAACTAAHGPGSLWAINGVCPADGGPDCAACTMPGSTADPACNDNDACTVDTCLQDQTACTHVDTPAIGATECCNPANNVRTNNFDDDPCTRDICSLGGNSGVAQNPDSAEGAPCDDNNPCSGSDQCTGGTCGGTNVNGQICVEDADCQGDGTPGAVCDGGVCLCRLNPNVSIGLSHDDEIGDKDNACYADNEKVTATIHIGPAANTIVGVQFAIVYNPDCMAFQSIQPAGPWTSILMLRLGGTCAGGVRDGQACGAQGCGQGGGTCVPDDTIFYAAGVPLGGAIGICDGGTNDKGFCNFSEGSCPGGACVPLGAGQGSQGNSDAAVLRFNKRPGCFGKPGQPECEICFSDNNPLHTYFSDDTGQPVGADTKCSEGIRTKSPIDLDVPDTIKINKGCDSNVGEVTWSAPTAGFGCNGGELACNGIHLETGTAWDAGHVNGGGVFPAGNSNFCCVATNNCNNVVEKCWTVTVNDETSLEVEVQLSPTMKTKQGDGITRCIKFEVFNNCVQAPIVFETDLEFGGLLQLVGHFNGHIKIPAAVQPACITARDQHHTLRSCYTFGEGDCDANGVLHAAFKQDPFFGGNWLVGGNLDGWKKSNPTSSHDIIDILDFGTLVSEWLSEYDSDGDGEEDGNTPCELYGDTAPGNGNHADINGDGLVDQLDFSFIAMNFLDNSKDCCCPGSASLGNTVGRTEITVRELREQGMSDLTVADLNADGKVDMADMAALMQGVRPNLKANDGSKDGSRSNNRK